MKLAITAMSCCWVSCAQQEVVKKVDLHSYREGMRYTGEVESQSPFKPMKQSWSGALALMKERNLEYLKAKKSFYESRQKRHGIQQFGEKLTESVKLSVQDALKPTAIVKSVKDPVAGLPQQLSSVTGIKDISHQMEQEVWKGEVSAVEARLVMRREQVKLYGILARGEVIESELKRVKAQDLAAIKDGKQKAAHKKWVAKVEKDRAAWLNEVRDFFNAEYYDVKFTRDESEMPDYRGVATPNLEEWQRWCFLSRSQKLVKELTNNHDKGKPVVPGERLVRTTAVQFVGGEPEYDVELEEAQLRGEVRKLIRNWREMKSAQADQKELMSIAKNGAVALAAFQQQYALRQKEIKHASVVWMLDEHCWLGDVY